MVFMDKIPRQPSAGGGTYKNRNKGAASLVNAVLRKLSVSLDNCRHCRNDPTIKYSHSKEFIDYFIRKSAGKRP